MGRAGSQHDAPAGWAGAGESLLGVAQQVEQYLHQPPGVDPDRGDGLIAGGLDLELAIAPRAIP